MAPTEFQGTFAPRDKRFTRLRSVSSAPWKANFSFKTIMVIGAAIQTLVTLVLPRRYALFPFLAIFLHTVGTAIVRIATFDARKPPVVPTTDHDAPVPDLTASVIPSASYNPAKGETPFSKEVGKQQGVVAFHLSSRINHPLGNFAPGALDLLKYFEKGVQELMERADDYGCLGCSSWEGETRQSQNTGLVVFYFRDVEGLHRFAHDKIHREGWDWYWNFVKKQGYRHIGINHETFYSPPGCWETINGDMPPTLLGAASVPVKNEATGQREWVNTLVGAENPKLRTQKARLGLLRQKGGVVDEKGVSY
ncbi:hypothetical protein QBC47DRAFT_338586 [Echria macrotheca]|uniref:Monooxygenase n=1 Tax=Echria macrotheca TaxID=438768 RepID=A0AAJ0BKM8_9PEZI|nr:hypothetical protein QBC47DRAFT_338586 [Echria macrotheca]